MARAIIVGAGMVGLATAWHLQERGYDVKVVDRDGVAAGSSWGNAGWLAPAKTIPLAESGLWGQAPSLLLDPDAALSMPFKVDVRLWKFLAQFMAHASDSAWDKTMEKLTPIDKVALEAFDELELGGVEAKSHEGPFVIGFKSEPDSRGFFKEIAYQFAMARKLKSTAWMILSPWFLFSLMRFRLCTVWKASALSSQAHMLRPLLRLSLTVVAK